MGLAFLGDVSGSVHLLRRQVYRRGSQTDPRAQTRHVDSGVLGGCVGSCPAFKGAHACATERTWISGSNLGRLPPAVSPFRQETDVRGEGTGSWRRWRECHRREPKGYMPSCWGALAPHKENIHLPSANRASLSAKQFADNILHGERSNCPFPVPFILLWECVLSKNRFGYLCLFFFFLKELI